MAEGNGNTDILEQLRQGIGKMAGRLEKVEGALELIRKVRDREEDIVEAIWQVANVMDRKVAMGPEVRDFLERLRSSIQAAPKPAPTQMHAEVEGVTIRPVTARRD